MGYPTFKLHNQIFVLTTLPITWISISPWDTNSIKKYDETMMKKFKSQLILKLEKVIPDNKCLSYPRTNVHSSPTEWNISLM